MPKRSDYAIRSIHHVFQRIDMKGGDKTKCWPWLGYVQNGTPLFTFNGKRLPVRRVVWGLKNGKHHYDAPHLSLKCGNNQCCNIDHMFPFAIIAGKIRHGETHAEAYHRLAPLQLPYNKRGKKRVLTKEFVYGIKEQDTR